MDFHKPRIDCLIEAECDLLAIETIPCSKEAVSIMKIMEMYHPNCKAWLTFTCKVCKKISMLNYGQNIELSLFIDI